MNVSLISVPYDSGHRGVRMGCGPRRLLSDGLVDALEKAGASVTEEEITLGVEFPTEATVAFLLAQKVAERVEETRKVGGFPLILAGNCFSALGTVAGWGTESPGVIWFDSHADFNTPDTTSSGFLDGTALAALCGRCWHNLARTISGFSAVAEERVVLVGARDFDPAERDLLAGSGVTVVEAETIRENGVERGLSPTLEQLRKCVDQVYLHLDLDALDPAEACANEYAAPDGMSVAQVEDAIGAISERFPIAGAALTAYDPAFDPDGKASRAAQHLLCRLVEGVSEAHLAEE